MAISAKSIFSAGGVTNTPQIGGTFNKFEQSAEPRHKIGQMVVDGEGNVYRYSHFGAATTLGLVVSPDLSESSLADSDNLITAPASCAVSTDGTTGQRFVELNTFGAVKAGDWRGAKFIVSDLSGEGYTYDIVNNTVSGDPVAGAVRLELRQPLQVALDATSCFIITGSRYSNLEVATAAADCTPVGVTCRNFTEDYFGWIQTKGVVGIYCEATTVNNGAAAVGDVIALSPQVSGHVTKMNDKTGEASDEAILGVCVVDGDTSGLGAYYINLD